MKLPEEIADLLAKRYFEVGFFPTLEAYPADLEIAEELVNKVLDAAVEAMDLEIQAEHDGADEYNHRARESYLYGCNRMKAAINKLRGK